MLVCPRCRGLVEAGSPLCPTCAYDPHTGDTALNPPRAQDPAKEPSTVSIVVSGLSMLIAIGLVVFAGVYAFRTQVIDRPGTIHSFATESGSSPGGS